MIILKILTLAVIVASAVTGLEYVLWRLFIGKEG